MAPAATTVTGVSASSCRSAEMSKLVSAPAMHAPDTARSEHMDARQMRRDHGRGDRRGPGATRGDTGGQIGARQFGDMLRLTECVEFRRLQPDMHPSAHHRDGRRHSTCVTHILFDQPRGLHVLRKRHHG